jgi:cyclomaltodextrinase / maltogenic alpha-amylase / neopullulanase
MSTAGREIFEPFSLQAQSLKKGTIYEHYKGKCYKILGVGRHSETLEEYVVYQELYGNGDIWIRPLSMFLEEIAIDGKTAPRFKCI